VSSPAEIHLHGHRLSYRITGRGDYSLGANASLTRDLMLALGHDRATIVGHSLGLDPLRLAVKPSGAP
jgi:pimeloyl-ACP methyl ester carboxylesterase